MDGSIQAVQKYTRLERALQFGAVIFVVCVQFACIGISLLLCLNLFTLPFMLVYLAWIYMDKTPFTGGKKSPIVRNLAIWRHFRDYFPITVKKSGDLDASKNYVFGYHPHGVITLGAFSAFLTNATEFSSHFPGIDCSLLGLNIVTRIPFSRELIGWLGGASVSRESCDFILGSGKPGRSICIVIGGAQEALDAVPDTLKLTLARRKGFVKVAITHGASLVPVLAFGENDIWDQVTNPKLRSIQDRLQKLLGFSVPLFHGRGFTSTAFGIFPRRKPITVVVGRPIECPKVSQPSQEQIDEYHKQYCDQLVELYNRHKDKHMISRRQSIVIR